MEDIVFNRILNFFEERYKAHVQPEFRGIEDSDEGSWEWTAANNGIDWFVTVYPEYPTPVIFHKDGVQASRDYFTFEAFEQDFNDFFTYC
jgi:hypothetical protein